MKIKISQIKSDIQREKVGEEEAGLRGSRRRQPLAPGQRGGLHGHLTAPPSGFWDQPGIPRQAWSLPERGVGEGPSCLGGERVPGGVRPLHAPWAAPGRPLVVAGEMWVSGPVRSGPGHSRSHAVAAEGAGP